MPLNQEDLAHEKRIKDRNEEFLNELRRYTPEMRFGSRFDNKIPPPSLRLVESLQSPSPQPCVLEGHGRILLAKAA